MERGRFGYRQLSTEFETMTFRGICAVCLFFIYYFFFRRVPLDPQEYPFRFVVDDCLFFRWVLCVVCCPCCLSSLYYLMEVWCEFTRTDVG